MIQLDSRVGGNTRSILEITGTGGQIQSLYTFAGDNYTAIQSNTTRIGQLDTNGDNLQKKIDRHGTDIINTANAVGETIIDLKSLQELTQNLNTLITNTASNVQSVITQQNLIRNRVDALERAPKSPLLYRSQEFLLSQYDNGKTLLIGIPLNYDPMRVVMKARNIYTGFIYVVNPGSDYGFNFRHKTQVNSGVERVIEVAIGSAGLFLMTNGGSARNILTGQ